MERAKNRVNRSFPGTELHGDELFAKEQLYFIHLSILHHLSNTALS